MTREEIDVLWQQAAEEAFDNGETYRRYEFANLILEKAASECDARYMGDNNREDMEAKRCAESIRSMKVCITQGKPSP